MRPGPRSACRSKGRLAYVIDTAACNAARASGCDATPATVSLGTTTFGEPTPLGIAVVEATNTVYTANLNDGEAPGSVSMIDGTNCNGHDTHGCGQTPPRA